MHENPFILKKLECLFFNKVQQKTWTTWTIFMEQQVALWTMDIVTKHFLCSNLSEASFSKTEILKENLNPCVELWSSKSSNAFRNIISFVFFWFSDKSQMTFWQSKFHLLISFVRHFLKRTQIVVRKSETLIMKFPTWKYLNFSATEIVYVTAFELFFFFQKNPMTENICAQGF